MGEALGAFLRAGEIVEYEVLGVFLIIGAGEIVEYRVGDVPGAFLIISRAGKTVGGRVGDILRGAGELVEGRLGDILGGAGEIVEGKLEEVEG